MRGNNGGQVNSRKTEPLVGLGRLPGLAAALSALALSAMAQAVRPPIPQVRIERIASARLGEVREAWVSLPDRYDETGDRYPVLYMLDGEINFNSGVIGGLRQAALLGEMPEFIVVGVVNTDRSKDIFPKVVTYGDGTKDGGRADAFLVFIGDDLVPRIEKTYRTEPFRVLYGTSNTGFTAVYALFKYPPLANVTIAASATLSVPILRDIRDAWIRDFNGGDKRMVLIMGENDLPTVLSQNGALKEQCDLLAPAGLSCRMAVLDGGHVPGDSLLEGLRLAFEGWRIATPLDERTFPEVRARADARLERFGVAGRIPEEELRGLAGRLLGRKAFDKAAEVLKYTVERHPGSVDAWNALGDANRSLGRADKAKACYLKAAELARARSEARAPGRGPAGAPA